MIPWISPSPNTVTIVPSSTPQLYSLKSLALLLNTLNVFDVTPTSSTSLISNVLLVGSISKFLSPTNVCTKLLFFVVLVSFSLVPFPSSPYVLFPAAYTNPVFKTVNVLLYPDPTLNTFVPFSFTCTGVDTDCVEFIPNCPFVFVPHVYAFSFTLWYAFTLFCTDISIALDTFDTFVSTPYWYL